jgi:hypothetical protein
MNARPRLHPSDHEVARILEVPVDALLAPDAIAWTTLVREEREYDVPLLAFEDVEIWGATAMVLAEFLILLGWTGPKGEAGEFRSE